jgi:hypothetical protein
MKRWILICAALLAWQLCASYALAARVVLSSFTYQGSAQEESLVLKMKGQNRVRLAGWTLSNKDGVVYTFPAVTLKNKRQTLTVYSAAGEDMVRGPNKQLFAGSESELWNDAGDILTLRNSQGRTVATRSYGDQAPPFEKTVFFIHHSTGGIYWDSGLRAALQQHGYTGQAPWWEGGTDPQDFPVLFNDSNSWDIFGGFGIILFKSCFPSSQIDSDELLEQYKSWYRELYAIYRARPEKLFVPMSTPPLLRGHTDAAAAARALAFEAWLLNAYNPNMREPTSPPSGCIRC